MEPLSCPPIRGVARCAAKQRLARCRVRHGCIVRGDPYGCIATVVDDFINRIMIDPKLNANPLVDEAHHKVPPAGFKYLVTEMLCWAAGGPQRYTGRGMEESHRHLAITAGEWDAFMEDLKATLDKFSVGGQLSGSICLRKAHKHPH